MKPPRPEITRQREAFEAWYDNDRSSVLASPVCGVPTRTLRRWAEKLGWNERADERDAELARRTEAAAIERREKALEERRQAGELLRRRGVQWYSQHEVQDGREAIAAIVKGVELESDSETQATRVELTGKDGGPILIADVSAARAELGEKLARLADAFGAREPVVDALPEDALDPEV